jgi:Tol biopolymer transport system component
MRRRHRPEKGPAFLLCVFVLCSRAGCAALPGELEQVGTGVVSTMDDESGFALAPDRASAFFTKRSPTTNTPPRSVICVTRRIGGHWGEPQIAPFSGRYNDFGVAVSVDGRRVVFSSDRPDPTLAGAAPNIDLWFADREGDGWSAPRNLGAPIDTPATEAYPSLAADGTLYFASTRPGGRGGADIYRARRVDDGYAAAENLGDINGPGYESQPAIAPDQSFLVFTASGRDDAMSGGGAPYPRTDLYISFRRGDGWGEPRRLGPPINGAWSSHFASPTRDGSLYFTSDRPGGKGSLDVWVARYVDGRYQPPVDLGAAINNEQWANFEVYVAPDESWMVVSAYGHEDSLGDCDLYVSIRRDGEWQPLRNPGPAVNSAARDYSARATPDGRYLFFASERGVPTEVRDTPWTYPQFTQAIRGVRNGLGNIYQVDLDVVLQAAAK